MKPGLHALVCIRCGAPLDPKDADVGSVVRCEHCDQPHLWVAPDKVEAEPAPPPPLNAAPARRAPSKAPILLLAVGALAVLLMVGGAVSFLFIRGTARPAGSDGLLVPSDAPLVRGDQVEMVLRSPRSVQTCPVDIVDFAPDGRPVGVPCNGSEPTPIGRELLELRTYRYEEPQQLDVVLVKTASGWQRAMVEAPEGGGKYRLKSLVPGGESFSAAKEALARVQGRTFGELRGPLPPSAPLAEGDVLWHRKGTVLHAGRVDEVGEGGVVLAPGYVRDGKFAPSPGSSDTVPKTSLLAPIVRMPDALERGSNVLARSGSAWQRHEVDADLGHLVRLKDGSGKLVELPKQELFLVRVPGAPPASSLAELGGSTAPNFHKAITPALRRCFQQALQKDPKANGKISLELNVGAQGQVVKAKATQTGALPASMLSCAEDAAKKAKLEPPDGGAAIVRMSATFVSQ